MLSDTELIETLTDTIKKQAELIRCLYEEVAQYRCLSKAEEEYSGNLSELQ